MATLFSGAVFGAATVAAGVYSPSVIISQFKFEDFHMLQAFLGASASSALIYKVAEGLGYISLKPRSSSPIGIFGQYDGNIIGGSLLGAGMAISGSCPGTIFAQAGAGLQTGFYALGGAAVGGILYTGVVSKLIKLRQEQTGVKPEVATLHEQAGLSNTTVFLLWEAITLSVIAATVTLSNGASDWTLFSAGSGIFLGLAQLFSILTRKSMLGISTSYEEIGNHFWWLVQGAKASAWPSSRQNLIFALGAAIGAWLITQNAPGLVAGNIVEAAPALAAVGGCMMAIGSRVAGGCTSGHGLSGLALFSTSSLITVACMFISGGLLAPLVHN